MGQGQQGVELLAGCVVRVLPEEGLCDFKDSAVPQDPMEGLRPEGKEQGT